MIPSSDRYARCEKASHVVNRLPVIRRAYGAGKMGETLGYLEIFEDGQPIISLPLNRGAVWVIHDKLLELIRG